MLTVSTGPIAAKISCSRRSSVLNGRLPTKSLRPISTPAPQGSLTTTCSDAGRVEGGIEVARSARGRAATTNNEPLVYRTEFRCGGPNPERLCTLDRFLHLALV